MTKQTKHYIELSDIKALRFECIHCKASLSLSLNDAIDVRKLRSCPNCNEPWAAIPNSSSVEQVIDEFIRRSREMNQLLSGDSKFPKGFTMVLETVGDKNDE